MLCGCVGMSAEGIEAMASRLGAGSSYKSVRAADAALAAGGSAAQIYSNGHSLVAIAGALDFSDSALAGYSRAHGPAKTFADHYQGPEILQSCSGAFSLALMHGGEVLIATDRMGIHPLYFAHAGTAFLFASNLDSIVSHPRSSPKVNAQTIYNYVYFHMVPGPQTIYVDHVRLLPGEYARWRKGGCEVGRYWQIEFEENRRTPLEELKARFVSTIENAVREAANGGRCGTFLSGGTDSSTLAGMLSRIENAPARTYSIGFAEAGYDEMGFARIAAKHFGTKHNEYYVTPADIVSAIPKITQAHGEPFGNSSAVPTYYCAKLAKEDGVARLLGGDGGDELFGGNARYAKQSVFARYEKLPLALRRFALEPAVAAAGGTFALARKAKSYIEQASVPMPARLESYNLLERFGAARVFTADFLACVDTAQPHALIEQAYFGTNAKTLINRMLALDFRFTLADNDLPKVTRSCELAAIDVRFPLLADSVVAFSAQLAPELKLKGSKLRWFFKEALRDFLPPQILAKEKHGFGLPFGPWLKTHPPLQDLVAESLNGLKSRQIVRAQFLDELMQTHLDEHAGYYGTMIWVLVMLEQWFERH